MGFNSTTKFCEASSGKISGFLYLSELSGIVQYELSILAYQPLSSSISLFPSTMMHGRVLLVFTWNKRVCFPSGKTVLRSGEVISFPFTKRVIFSGPVHLIAVASLSLIVFLKYA